MKNGRIRSARVRKAVAVVAAVGAAHFFVSIGWWGWVVVSFASSPAGLAGIDWSGLRFALPAVLLLVVFLIALVFAWRRRVAAIFLLALAIPMATLSFIYDTQRGNYQIQVMTSNEGCKHVYLTWWWHGG